MPGEPLLEKADRFIRSAELLAADGDADSAASRLYYAMFFVAQALLATREQAYSSHKAVISAFGQQFAKTQEMDPRFHRALIAAFSQRQAGDYAVKSGLGPDDVAALMVDAVQFVAAARKWLAEHGSDKTVPD